VCLFALLFLFIILLLLVFCALRFERFFKQCLCFVFDYFYFFFLIWNNF